MKRIIINNYDEYNNIILIRHTNKIKSYTNIINYDYIENNDDKYTDISIQKEILRSIIINKIIKIFTDCIKTFRIKNLGLIFKYNKLNDYVQKWCWLQYENPNIMDTVIPYIEDESYNFNEFLEDFNYTMKKANIELSDIKQLINNIKSYLKKTYLDFKNAHDESIKLNKLKDGENVILKCVYLGNEYKVIINNNVYIRLIKKCNSTNIDCDTLIFCLIYRYSYIDAENQQLAIHKKIKDMFKTYGVNFELYGSAINVLSDNYCSLFYDIEKYFGSKGNFFNIELKSGIYWCNPPYINNLMTKTAYKLIECMNNTNNIAFILTIPIWDKATQSLEFNEITRNYNEQDRGDNFDDYPIYALLKPYIKDELIIPKNRIPYFNYRHYKPINARDTYMFIIYKDIQIKEFHSVFDNIIELDKTDYFILNN